MASRGRLTKHLSITIDRQVALLQWSETPQGFEQGRLSLTFQSCHAQDLASPDRKRDFINAGRRKVANIQNGRRGIVNTRFTDGATLHHHSPRHLAKYVLDRHSDGRRL